MSGNRTEPKVVVNRGLNFEFSTLKHSQQPHTGSSNGSKPESERRCSLYAWARWEMHGMPSACVNVVPAGQHVPNCRHR